MPTPPANPVLLFASIELLEFTVTPQDQIQPYADV